MQEMGKEGSLQEAEECFKAADSNGDGLLDLAEFTDFRDKMQAKMVERGAVPFEQDADSLKAIYDIHNSVTPETDGISANELMANI